MWTELFSFLRMGLLCGTVLAIAFVVALSLPKSKMQTVLSETCCWAAIAFCGFYAVSPVDILPELALGPLGFLDDLGALFLGWQAYKSAMQSREERKALD